MHELHCDRKEQHDEGAGKDEGQQRKQQLDRRFHGELFGAQEPFGAALVGLGTQDTTNECGGKACPVCPVDPANGEPYSLSADTLFDFDSAVLKTNGLTQLDTLIDEVKAAQKDGQTIQSATVTGYTDQLGSDAVNLKLSQARAEAVRDYMKRRGFPDVPITVVGKGAANPVVPMEGCGGATEQKIACLAPNRRVMVDIKRSASQP
jgi:outer membrane protein OmpA-like peptidoglycan-associated protein